MPARGFRRLGIGGQHLQFEGGALGQSLAEGFRMVAVIEIDDDVADIDRDARERRRAGPWS
jgi:hypothetical protein